MLVMAAALALTGCGGDEPVNGQPIQVKPEAERTILVMDRRGNVYDTDGQVTATIGNPAAATDYIIPFANDYYVTGSTEVGNAVGYWKNGVWNWVAEKPLGYRGTFGICKHHDDIYLLINQTDGVYVYKNSLLSRLSSDGNDHGMDITATDSHTFVAGSRSADGTSVAALWTDGERQLLPAAPDALRAEGYCVFAIGSHTLVGGHTDNAPTVWIDGELYTLPIGEGYQTGVVYDVAEQGGKVYSLGKRVTASGLNRATVWVEGQSRNYVAGDAASTSSEAIKIQFYSQDCYVLTVEHEAGSNNVASHVWFNGRLKCSLPGVNAAGFVVI